MRYRAQYKHLVTELPVVPLLWGYYSNVKKGCGQNEAVVLRYSALGLEEDQTTIVDCFGDLISECDSVDIAVGFMSQDWLLKSWIYSFPNIILAMSVSL